MNKSEPPKELKWVHLLYLSFFFGWLGVDRFILGNIALGILKLITFGGCGIWWLVDFILIASSNRFKNVVWKHPKNKLVHLCIVIGIALFFFVINPLIFGSDDNNTNISTSGELGSGELKNEISKENIAVSPEKVKLLIDNYTSPKPKSISNDKPIHSNSETKTDASQIVSDNLADFVSNFWRYTDLQREEIWKEYDGKYVKWTFYVSSVGEEWLDTYTVLGNVKKPGPYDIGSDVAVIFTSKEKDNLLKYSEGDLMTIIGVLDSYTHSFMNTIQVKQAKVTSTEQIKYAKEGEYSKDCQDMNSRCNYGDMDACLVFLNLQQSNIC